MILIKDDDDLEIFKPKVLGYFMIKFINVYHINNDYKIIEYLTIDFIYKQPYILKLYVDKDHKELEKDNLINIDGVLRHNTYKDKRTNEWIDKGIYIEVYQYEEFTPEFTNKIKSLHKTILKQREESEL